VECNSQPGQDAIVIGLPGPPLAPFVELFWHDSRYASLTHRERVLPVGAFTIVFDLARGTSSVNGVRSKCIEVETAPVGTVVGVLFRAGGARAFFRGSAGALYNKGVSLDRLWQSAGTDLCTRMREASSPLDCFQTLERALTHRLRPHVIVHPAVERGLNEFRQVPHVRQVLEVVKDTGLSRRRFSELFRNQVGITPKRYCRLHRFYAVVRQLSSGIDVDWADVALACGYSDQAHLIHEFREFSGFTPAAFLDAERPSGAHVCVS
jgi:AraC-like DNA-binding protein